MHSTQKRVIMTLHRHSSIQVVFWLSGNTLLSIAITALCHFGINGK